MANRNTKDRIGFMFFLAIVFTMSAVAVKVLLLMFGTGLLGASLSCLALAFMLFILLHDTNPRQ